MPLAAAIPPAPDALALVMPMVAVVLGLGLWTAGTRVLRPALAVAGGALGAYVAYRVATFFIDPAASAPTEAMVPPWLAAVIAGMITACVAALLQRLAVALALAGVLGLGAPLVALGVQVYAPGPSTGSVDGVAATAEEVVEPPRSFPTVDEANAWLFPEPEPGVPPDGDLGWAGDKLAASAGLPPEATEAIGSARATADRAVGGLRAWWNERPARQRPLLAGSAIAGALAGLLLGSLFMRFATVIVTSFGGVLMWGGGLVTLGGAAGIDAYGWLAETPVVAAVLWIVLSAIGGAIQWTVRGKTVDTTA